MNLSEINEIYKKLGIGKDEERQKYIDMSKIYNENQNEYYFIQYSPISSFNEEKENAQLA